MSSALGILQKWLGELQERAGVWQSLAAAPPSFSERPPWQTCKQQLLDERCMSLLQVGLCHHFCAHCCKVASSLQQMRRLMCLRSSSACTQPGLLEYLGKKAAQRGGHSIASRLGRPCCAWALRAARPSATCTNLTFSHASLSACTRNR